MKAMTVIEIVHTHPFAAVTVGIILAFGSLLLCTAFLFSLEKMKAISRDNARAESGNPERTLFSESSVGSPDSSSVT